MMHIKDVFPFLANREEPPANWTSLMRQPLYVPQARGALDVLADMRSMCRDAVIIVDTAPAKRVLPNATRSMMPMATGGSTAHRNGARVAHADTSRSQA